MRFWDCLKLEWKFLPCLGNFYTPSFEMVPVLTVPSSRSRRNMEDNSEAENPGEDGEARSVSVNGSDFAISGPGTDKKSKFNVKKEGPEKLIQCSPGNITKAWREFWGKFRRRVWNFYIEALLIPVFRVEWGKYKDWMYKYASRPPSTLEAKRERRRVRMEHFRVRRKSEIIGEDLAHDESGCALVNINVSGLIFQTQIRTLNSFPDTLLGKRFSA